MLPGFELETIELTDYEKNILVPIFVNGFKNRYGKEKAVTNKQIVEKLKVKFTISDARVRKIINYIRNNDLVPGLIASSEGYYVTRNIAELQKYIKSLQGRENEIRRVKEGMIKCLKKLSIQQQSHFSFPEINQ